MRSSVLVIHNYYRQRGGEDNAVDAQIRLLNDKQVKNELFYVRSGEVAEASLPVKALRFAQVPWSITESRRLRTVLDAGGWKVVHFHNITPFLSPSVVAAAASPAIRTVMTLHNFRPFCINGLFFRQGRPCEECVSQNRWAGIRHRCHEGRLAQSTALSLAQWTARHIAAISECVHTFLCPSRFHLEKYRTNGFPPERLVHLANFIPDPGAHGPAVTGPGIYLGRYSEEKGVKILARSIRAAKVPFVFAGEGPLKSWLRARCAGLPGVKVLGWQNAEGVDTLFRNAAYAVVPSICYENQPLFALEALGRGLPLLVSDIGGTSELVRDRSNGRTFPAGEEEALADALQQMRTFSDAVLSEMGQRARALYEQEFTKEKHWEHLQRIYGLAKT